MRVFKFGGASVKDSGGIRNLRRIVARENGNLAIVVSAFGKTTNALEEVLNRWHNRDEGCLQTLASLRDYHLGIAVELFGIASAAEKSLAEMFTPLENILRRQSPGDYDHDYDMIVSMGEIWSTMVVEGYLREKGLNTRWIDIRQHLITDARYREANIMWEEARERITAAFNFNDTGIYVTQGFIGATLSGQPTTLGREGSDYTAAILANMLDAENVVVWKDVPGIMNADPKWMKKATTIDEISYNEAVEMTFSGAKVIHPKTIKPLHNKKIPLHVRSFIDHEAKGTVIYDKPAHATTIPVFVRKEDQILISVLPKDLSFVMGENLSELFLLFSEKGIKINLVQAGAVSINVCADNDLSRIREIIETLGNDYTILYNEGVEMLTVRHYDKNSFDSVTEGMEVLLSQTTRTSLRIVARRLEAGH